MSGPALGRRVVTRRIFTAQIKSTSPFQCRHASGLDASPSASQTSPSNGSTTEQTSSMEYHVRRNLEGVNGLKREQIESMSDTQLNSVLFPNQANERFGRVRRPRMKAGLMNMGVKPGPGSQGQESDPEFEYDDISSISHGDLEQHRELRHYARLAAWEMPLLTKMAQEFKAPTGNQILRWRTTSYLGEDHPAATKVVLEFCPLDIPDLTRVQTHKLCLLLGPRYKPHKGDWVRGIAKLSCEQFDGIKANQRYLEKTLYSLIQECQDPNKDTFEDIPLDKRHAPQKKKISFPRSWRIDSQGERLRALEAKREEGQKLDRLKEGEGRLIDGVSLIEEAMAKVLVQEVPIELKAGGAKRVAKRLGIRR